MKENEPIQPINLAEQQALTQRITEVAAPDGIYLLGRYTCIHHCRTLFTEKSAPSHSQTQYWLLITLPDSTETSLFAWQDKIEHHCRPIAPVITIVMYSSTFQQWIKEQRWFAIRTLKEAEVFFVQNEWAYRPARQKPADPEILKNVYCHGSMNARNFLEGAQFFLTKDQLHLAAFMLHQAAEQSLRTLLKIRTGFTSQTHNVLRLMGYVRFIINRPAPPCYSLEDKDRPLATLLQKAYTEARYKIHFQISRIDVVALVEKVKEICGLLEVEGINKAEWVSVSD